MFDAKQKEEEKKTIYHVRKNRQNKTIVSSLFFKLGKKKQETMKQIAIYGAGGFGREVACLLNKINDVEPTWELVGFFDDGIEIGKEVSHFGKTLGGINELNAWPTELGIAFTIGNPQTVEALVSKVTNPKIHFPNIIAPTVYFADPETFKIGKGNIIQKHRTRNCNASG